jgi:hypothetical protein
VSVQRRRGVQVTLFPRKLITDTRGNEVLTIDLENPVVVTAAAIPQRSARAEIPGQQEIEIVRLIVTADLPDVGLWGGALYDGREWDIAAPPAYHHGTRRTRHFSIDIRKRP